MLPSVDREGRMMGPQLDGIPHGEKGVTVMISLLLASMDGSSQNLSIFDPVSPPASPAVCLHHAGDDGFAGP
jgi:hypothetical protein